MTESLHQRVVEKHKLQFRPTWCASLHSALQHSDNQKDLCRPIETLAKICALEHHFTLDVTQNEVTGHSAPPGAESCVLTPLQNGELRCPTQPANAQGSKASTVECSSGDVCK